MTTKCEIKETIGISESLTLIAESQHLLVSNRDKCADLLKKSELTNEDKIDFLISLHLVLEVGINALFRQFFFRNHGLGWISDERKVEYLDEISFKDKVTAIIYFAKFRFNSDSDRIKADEYLSVIEQIKTFSQVRNKLLHGHSLSKTTVLNGKDSKQTVSKTSKLIPKFDEQVGLFKSIVEAVAFYIRNVDCTITPEGRESMIKEFIDDDFLLQSETP